MPEIGFATSSVAEVETAALILPVFEGPEAGPGVDEAGKALGVDLVATLRDNALRGRLGETLSVPTLGRLHARTVVLVGLGKRGDVRPDTLRRAAGKVARVASRFESVATTLARAARPAPEAVQAVVEGLLLGSYRFDRFKSRSSDGDALEPAQLQHVTVLGVDEPEAAHRAQVTSESVAWARDLVNTPAGSATPEFLADEARKMAKETGLDVKIWTKSDLEKGGFGGVLGVGQGSVNPPRLIELAYEGANSGDAPIAITGKGVTFDSGGLSIKDAKGMEWMKADMGGAAAMLAAMRAIAILRPKVNVIAAIPSSENLPSGSAIRPGDVLTHRGGTTSEVLNTDAEGRLILADALAYLAEQNPRVIIDAATLTGACMIALGEDIWGVMGNDRRLIRDVIAAGDAVGEPGWELPLWRRYRAKIDSPVADVKNIGDRYGGAITAALFLAEFVGDTPWCHLDVAGTAFWEKAGDYWPKGATGSPARTIVRYVLDRAADDAKKGGGRPKASGAKSSRSSAKSTRTAGAAKPRSRAS
ncbi:MAG TPA: leucyl aminopeptidase [Actinomycetota bacterium]|nr:leucyl aminopeptidase [Actinomycetota bacterium]